MSIHGEKLKGLFDKYGIDDSGCGNYIGDGWIPIVDEMFEKMIAAGWDKRLAQIKSKFCELRVYTDASAEVLQIISHAEIKANSSCEECGMLHSLTTPRSGIALCAQCEARWKERQLNG